MSIFWHFLEGVSIIWMKFEGGVKYNLPSQFRNSEIVPKFDIIKFEGVSNFLCQNATHQLVVGPRGILRFSEISLTLPIRDLYVYAY